MAETQGWGSARARRFGLALVLLGVTMLVFGIAYHLAFMTGLRHERGPGPAGTPGRATISFNTSQVPSAIIPPGRAPRPESWIAVAKETARFPAGRIRAGPEPRLGRGRER